VICLLGNTAVQTILGEKSLRGVVGRRIVKEGQVFFATYHPAAVLYNPELQDDIREHMKRLSEVLSESEDLASGDAHTSLDNFL
jgi:DNA polymerase